MRAIPVAAGIEVVIPAIGHFPVAIGEAVDCVPRPILRAGPPAIAVAIRTPGATGLVVAIVVTPRNVLVVTGTRLLSLTHFIGPRLQR
ncbi:hypothetical protein D3C75_1264960 [compost metagenome]